MPPAISIIVPTFRRDKLLRILLDSFADQTILPTKYEVIVVDNYPTSDEPTQLLCRDPRYNLLNLKYVHDPVLGLNNARNFGLQYTSAPWVGFIDDDGRLPGHWVERALEIIENYSPDIFGGPYHPYYEGEKPAWFHDRYLIQTLGTKKSWIEDERALFGGNIIFQRAWLDRLKGFSTEIGRKGINQEVGGEVEIQIRARRQGAHLYYDPELYIFHFAHPYQFNTGWFLQNAWYHGKARARLLQRDERAGLRVVGTALVDLKNFLAEAFNILGLYAYLPFRDRKQVAFSENYLVEMVAPAVTSLGKNWYLLRSTFTHNH